MRLLSAHQRDFDWWDSRFGKVSGSNASSVLAFLKKGEKKGGETKERARYKTKLVTEMLLGAPVMDGFLSRPMKFGIENEDLARAAYEFKTGKDVDLVGFGVHDSIDRFGGSCDGLIGSDGILEIKCPESTTHIRWMSAGVVPSEHEPQMSAYLSITGREYVDFCSFDPRLPERFQLFIIRMNRDEARIGEVESAVVQFLAEVDEQIARLETLCPAKDSVRRQLEDSLGITDEDFAGTGLAPVNES